MIGYAWFRAGMPQRAAATLQRISDPRLAAGYDVGLAWAYQGLGRPRRALDHAVTAIRLMGPTPDVCTIHAESLEQLNRYSEAAAAWRQCLSNGPDNIDAFAAFARCLEEDNKSELADYLTSQPDRAALVEQLVDRVRYSQDRELLQVLLDVLRQAAPQAASLEQLHGQIAEFEGDDRRAAEHYRRCWEQTAAQQNDANGNSNSGNNTDAEVNEYDESAMVRPWLVGKYLHSAAKGANWLEAYRGAPDPEAALHAVYDLFVDGDFDSNDFRRIVELHLQSFLDSPMAVSLLADFLLDDEQYAQAEQLIRAALERASGEEAEAWLHTPLRAALVGLGRPLDAYEQVPPAADAFREIALKLSSRGDWQTLRALVERHETEASDDSALISYKGQLLEHEANWAEAVEHYKLALELCDPDATYLQQQWQRSWIRALLQTISLPGDIFDETGFSAEVLDALGSLLVSEERWSELREVVAAYRQAVPGTRDTARLEAELAWHDKAYRTAANRLETYLARQLPPVDNWEAQQLEERLVRCYLRQQDFDRALERATKQSADDKYLELACRIFAGQADQVLDIVGDGEFSSWQISRIYHDPDLATIIRGDRFRELRLLFPQSVGGLMYRRANVLLGRGLPAPLDELLQRAGGQLSNEPQIIPLTATKGGEQATLLRAGDQMVCVVHGTGKYTSPEEVSDLDNESLLAAFNEHDEWLAVFEPPWNPTPVPGCQSLARELTLALAHAVPELGAVWDGNITRLLPNTRDGRAVLSGRSWVELEDKIGAIKVCYLWRDTALEEDADDPWQTLKWQRLRQLRREFACRKPGDKVEILVALDFGPVRGEHWLDLVRIDRVHYESYRYCGSLPSDSPARPLLVAGELLAAEDYAIRDWRVRPSE